MRKISLESIRNIKRLRRKGFSYKRMAKHLKMSVGSSYFYSNNIPLSKKAKRKLELRKIKNQKYFINKYAKIRKVNPPKTISKELIRIIGHCFFDGTVMSWGVFYFNTSPKLIKEFILDMKSVFNISPSIVEIYKKKPHHHFICRLGYYYTDISRHLLQYSPTYNTSIDKVEIPKFIFKLPKSLICEFLRTFWDDEGCVKSCGDVTAKIKSKNFADSLCKLHEVVEIKIKRYYDIKNAAYELYIPKHSSNLLKFRDTIGFKNAITHRGKNVGIYKTDLLNRIVGHL